LESEESKNDPVNSGALENPRPGNIESARRRAQGAALEIPQRLGFRV